MPISKLTVAQERAIMSRAQNLQIVAGAGSGKTQVLAERVARIISEGGTNPSEIACFTFTEKAATELALRVRATCLRSGVDSENLGELFIGTFHSFCNRFLNANVPQYFSYRQINEAQANLLVARYPVQSGLGTRGLRLNGKSFGSTPRSIHTYVQVMNILREDSINFSLLHGPLVDAFNRYKNLLQDKKILDFTSIVECVVFFLEQNEGSPKSLTHNYRHVIVDEYQDVNPLQERLISSLSRIGAQLTVVGDDDQTIYQWRGSDVTEMLKFSDRYDDVEIVELSDNFRSSPGVVKLANDFVGKISGERIAKSMVAASHQVFGIGDIESSNHISAEHEAAYIAGEIQSLLAIGFRDSADSQWRKINYSDIAILLRSVRADGGVIANALKSSGIPFTLSGTHDLLDSPAMVCLTSVYRFLADSMELNSWDIEALLNAAGLARSGEAILPHLQLLKDEYRSSGPSAQNDLGLQKTFYRICQILDLNAIELEDSKDLAEELLSDLGGFSKLISEYEDINYLTPAAEKIISFATWLSKGAREFYDRGFAAVEAKNAVQILTMHKAKGLEFPIVFIPALQAGRIPSTQQSGMNPFDVIPTTSGRNLSRYLGLEDDERRLLYVAITRSKKFLRLSFSPGNRAPYDSPSKFFEELCDQIAQLDPQTSQEEQPLLSAESKGDEQEALNLSFSSLKDYLECQFRYKLRELYGFMPPIDEALGYGKSIHDALAEVHHLILSGEPLTNLDLADIVATHFSAPFAYPKLKNDMEQSALRVLERYVEGHAKMIHGVIASEFPFTLDIDDNSQLAGRIDLLSRIEGVGVSLVDFKSTSRAQSEELTRLQLGIYALGLARTRLPTPDQIQILNLDRGGTDTVSVLDDSVYRDVKSTLQRVVVGIRQREFEKQQLWNHICSSCDVYAVCRKKPL
jgi:DNA helicase II / ATP-dependent DNA helicase PcrA